MSASTCRGRTHHGVPAVEGGDLRQREPLTQRDHRCIGGAQRQILVGEHEFGRAAVVLGSEFHWPQGPIGQGGQELRVHACPAFAGEQITDLGDDRAGNQNAAARQMQCREQIDALAVTGIVVNGRRHQRARVADDHRLAAEALGQQLVDTVRGIRATSRDRPEPRRRPRHRRGCARQSLHLDQGSRYLILGQLLDQAVQLIAGGGHADHDTSRRPEKAASCRRRQLPRACGIRPPHHFRWRISGGSICAQRI